MAELLEFPELPLPEKALFSAEPFSVSFLNDAFKKLQGQDDPFLGILKAECDQGILILFILHGEPYSAGGWLGAGARSLTLHEYFQFLVKLKSIRLSLYESDPVYLKCLMGLLQKGPTTQATTDLVNIDGLLERLQQESDENLLVLKKGLEHSFFYFLRKKLVEAYFVNREMKSKEASLEEALLSYVYGHQGPAPLELLLYSDLQVTHAPDAYPSLFENTMPVIVDHFLKPCPRLLLLHPRGPSREFSLHQDIFSVGRSEENDLELDDPLVSRRHATICRRENAYWLEDEKSRNGVLLNGQPVTTARLSDGDEIQIGEYQLRFEVNAPEDLKAAIPPAGSDGETVVLSRHPVVLRQPKCWLEVMEGHLSGTRFEISQAKTVLGRGKTDVVLLDPKVSRRHAVLEWTQDGYRFSNYSSTNGCFLNGERINNCLVASGDLIRLGGTTLKIMIEKMIHEFLLAFSNGLHQAPAFLKELFLNDQTRFYLKYMGMILFSLLALRILMSLVEGRRSRRGRAAGVCPANSRTAAREARRAEKRGDYRQAGDLYKAAAFHDMAIEMYKRARSHREVAVLYEQDKKWAEAAQYYESSGDLEKAGAMWQREGEYLRAGELLARARRPQPAAEMFERAGVHGKAADLYVRIGNGYRAAECYAKAKESAKAAELYEQCYRQERQKWQDSRQPASSTEREKAADLARQAARQYVEARSHEKAVSVLAVAGLDVEAADVLNFAGEHQKAAEIYYEMAQYMKAAQAYERAGDWKKGFQIQAEMHIHEENRAEAARCFEKAEEFFQSGELYAFLGDQGKAAEMYLRGGDYPKAAELFLEMGEPARAAQVYEQAGALKEAADLYDKLQHSEKAAELFRRIGQHYKAAVSLHRLGNQEESITLLQKVHSVSEDYYEASLLLSRIFTERGMLDAAKQRFDKLFSHQRPEAQGLEALYRLAKAYESNKEYEEALQVYDRILSEDFSFIDAKAKADGLRRAMTEIKKVMADARTVAAKPEAPSVHSPQRYKILKKIGQGGMGVVYRAEDTVLHRMVAYKVLPPSVRDSPKILESFMQEARVAAVLSHPGIVTVYDVGKEGSEVYITMEYVDGMTLKEHLDRHAPLPLPLLVGLTRQICRGLDYAHSKGVIHRDIKPANVMISRDFRVKIMDFGLAKIVSETMADKTTVKGTPMYMSPEQILGKNVDHQSDIYSLGCTVYKMATGKAPFTEGDLYYHHLHTLPSPPKEGNPDLPDSLDRIILRCIEKDKTERYQKVREILKDLDAIPMTS